MLFFARRKADDDWSVRNRIREEAVMVGQGFEPIDERIIGRDFGKALDQARWVCTIRVDKQDVKRHRHCTEVIEPVDKFGKQCPGPRPLAETFEAIVIDIHDAYRSGLVFARLQTQVFIKDVKSQLHQETGLVHPNEDSSQ
jgi:hypothetical protein